jgi:cyclopropane fatty-acyl-phospholipid synthase-like methyltransferase
MTNHPLALSSRDFVVPGGSMMDNTNKPEFLKKLYSLFELHTDKRSFALLDIGCSAGRMVEQVLQDGHFAAGLEGSDYSLARKRSSWGRIPGNLFTCDVTQDFTLFSKSVEKMCCYSRSTVKLEQVPFRFDVITAWELMEHIKEGAPLETLMDNVQRHLMPDGYFMMSVSSQKGYHHETVKGRDWWMGFFDRFDFQNNEEVCRLIGRDWPRGPNEPDSFNLALQRKNFYPE